MRDISDCPMTLPGMPGVLVEKRIVPGNHQNCLNFITDLLETAKQHHAVACAVAVVDMDGTIRTAFERRARQLHLQAAVSTLQYRLVKANIEEE